MQQVIIVPACFESFAFDSEFAGFVLFEQVAGDAVEQREVLCGMTGVFAVQVFCEADIQRPVEFVFDAPVLTDGSIQPLGIGLEAGDVM